MTQTSFYVVTLTVGRVVVQLSGFVFVLVSLCEGAHGREVVVAHGRGPLSSGSPSAAAPNRRPVTPPILHLVSDRSLVELLLLLLLLLLRSCAG